MCTYLGFPQQIIEDGQLLSNVIQLPLDCLDTRKITIIIMIVAGIIMLYFFQKLPCMSGCGYIQFLHVLSMHTQYYMCMINYNLRQCWLDLCTSRAWHQRPVPSACAPEEWAASAQGRGWETAWTKGENNHKYRSVCTIVHVGFGILPV